MRRKDKEIKDKDKIEEIVQDAQVCHLALAGNGQPYVVPLNFGYRDEVVYFHSARQGRKIDMLAANPRVCLEFSTVLELVQGETSCDWGQRFKSVIAFGNARLIEDETEKREALDIIMGHYGGQGGDYSDNKLKVTAVIEVKLTEMTGKGSV
ncbi:MAG: pyridoxamine 5'-phosphate oxidase family protein [Desulfobacterales bacterium]|nr:pyridoxamine 5'-phosphate oxidase family protein [Desulfobacterales bacterium]